MTMESRSFGTAVFPKLRDEEAIGALRDFIHELEEQKGKELTEKQTKALIRFTWGLISSIETEMQSNQIMNELVEQIRKETRFAAQLRKAITQHIPQSVNQALRSA